MPWEAWVLVSIFAANTLVTVKNVGEGKTSSTAGILVLVANGLLAHLVWRLA